MSSTVFNRVSFLFIICILLSGSNFLVGCKERQQNTEVISPESISIDDETSVDVLVLRNTEFYKQIICNGKLIAFRKSELRFRTSGELVELSVKNGNSIVSGQVIASLDKFETEQGVDQAEIKVKNAALEMEDIWIGYNGQRSRDSVSLFIKESFETKSGLIAANNELKSAKYRLDGTILRSPFAGKIANLRHRLHEQVSSQDLFCVVIDDSEFEVIFSLIESEIGEIRLNDRVTVTPLYSQISSIGFISEINPIINENGLVSVKARVPNPSSFIEGMNVKVIVEKLIYNEIVVPKSAVVIRENQEVIFKYVSGKAHWTYVEIMKENNNFYTVNANLNKGSTLNYGDTIIVSDNLNLAHQSVVRLKN